jgi:uncharacterized protein YegP (UPF0339 family)
MKITIYRDADGQWRWRYQSKGGRILADSGQGYANKRDCIRGLELVTGGSYERRYQQRTPTGHVYQQGALSRGRSTQHGSWVEEINVEVLP